MKKNFYILLTGLIFFSCNFTAHSIYTYDELTSMGLKNDLRKPIDQEVIIKHSDEIYDYLNSGVTSLSDILYFYFNNISPDTVRNYLETGVKDPNHFNSFEYNIIKAKKGFFNSDLDVGELSLCIIGNTSIACDIMPLIKNDIPVHIVHTYVDVKIRNPNDIIFLLNHKISAEMVRDYLTSGLDIKDSQSVLFESKLRVCDIVYLVEHKISPAVVHFFVNAGIKKSEDLVFLVQKNVSTSTLQAYLALGIKIDDSSSLLTMLEVSPIVSLVKHEVSVEKASGYVEAGVIYTHNIIFLVEHGISAKTVKDYLKTGLDIREVSNWSILGNKLRFFDIAFLIDHNVSTDIVSFYINSGITKSSDIVFLIENNVSIKTIQDYLTSGLKIKPTDSISCRGDFGIVSLIKNNISVDKVRSYVSYGVKKSSDIISLVRQGIPPQNIQDYIKKTY